MYRLRKAVPVRMMLPVQRFPRDMYLRMHYADEHRAHPDAGHDQIVRTLLDRFATLGDAEKKVGRTRVMI